MTGSTISRPQMSTAFVGFLLIGMASGAWGVLLPGVSAYYHVGRSVVGLLFFASATGYILSALGTGPLTAKLGQRWYLVIGTALFLFCCLSFSLKPPFVLALLVRLFQGMAGAMIEAGLNLLLVALPNNTALLNALHAFGGAGNLAGPLIASTLLAFGWGWNAAFLAWALLALPLLVGLLTLFPRSSSSVGNAEQRGKKERTLLIIVKMPMVWFTALFLLFYVGVEVSLGDWGYTFLTENRGANVELAGGIVSGYWLGLILGRFILNFIARRVHLSLSGQMNTCIVGMIFGILMIWFIPSVVASAAAFFVVGTFLGPIYPSTVALLPNIVKRNLVESAMGFLLGMSILGGALFPWVAGTLAQYRSIGALSPYALSLTVVMLALWWAMRRGLQSSSQENG